MIRDNHTTYAAESIIRRAERQLSKLYGCGVSITTEINTTGIATPAEIAECVSRVTGIPIKAMKSRSRKREIVEARQIAMTIIHDQMPISLKAIGDIFGGRDHSTVINAKHVVQDMVETNRNFRVKYNRCAQMVEMNLKHPNKELRLLPQEIFI